MQGRRYAIQRGLTLVELLLTLVVLGILAAMGAPSMRGLIVDLRVSGAASGFERVLRHGRSEAVSRGQIVRICPSIDGEFCDLGGRWENGWISYVDLDADSDRDAMDPMLQIRYGTENLLMSFNGGHQVSFNSLGRISRNASMDFCALNGAHPGRRLVMVHSGRLRVESPSPGCRNL